MAKQTVEPTYPGILNAWSPDMAQMALNDQAEGVDPAETAENLNRLFGATLARPFTRAAVVGKLWRIRRDKKMSG